MLDTKNYNVWREPYRDQARCMYLESNLQLAPPHATRNFGILIIALSISLYCVRTAFAAASSAFDLSANFTTDGVSTAISPVNSLSSKGSNSTYNKSASTGAYHEVLNLAAAGDMRPVLTIDAKNMSSHIKGTFGIDTISAEGDTTITTLTLNLVPKRAPGLAIFPYLQVAANTLKGTGNYDYTAPNHTAVSGVAGVSSLVITGSLVDNKTIKFSGSPKEDRLLYQSPTVTITLNQTVSVDLISCGPKCVVTPFSVRTGVLNITLTNASLGSRRVSGQRAIGAAGAGVEGMADGMNQR